MKDINHHIENRELLYAGNFSRTEVASYGILCWNSDFPRSLEGNHAVVLDKGLINGQTAGAVEMFYEKRGMRPAFMMKDDDKLLMGYLRDRGYIFYPSYEKLYVMMSHDLVAGHGMEDIAVCRDVDEKISGLAVQYDSSGWLLEKLTRLVEKKRFYILFWEGGDGKKAMMTYHDLGSYVRVGGYASEGEHVSFSRLVRGVTYFHSRRCHKPMTFALHKKPDMDGIHEGIMFTYAVQSL